jgi:IMP dehydrogenase/GMP reductase/intein/homing endonuclease
VFKQLPLTFDDVLLVPKYCGFESRKEVDISAKLGDYEFQIPIISSNMDTITGHIMAGTMAKLGGMGILHRFMTIDDNVNEFGQNTLRSDIDASQSIGISVGVNEGLDRVKALYDHGAKIFCVDVAHGHSKLVGKMIKQMKKMASDILIIAGNVCTYAGADYLVGCGADAIKVGVGPGCLGANTRILLSNGLYKNIVDIKPGDRIISMYGKPETVKSVYSTGFRETISIKNGQSFNKTIITPDHQCYIGDLQSCSKNTLATAGYAKILNQQSKTIPKKSKFKWKPISQSKNDVLLLPKHINFEIKNSFTINLEDYSIENRYLERYIKNILPTYDLGYIFGTFLGDGNYHLAKYNNSNRGSIHWSFGANELDIAKKLSLALKNAFGVAGTINIHKTKKIIRVSLYSKQFAHLFSEFGKRENKHLPEKYWCNNKDYQQGLWEGLIDSDGYVSDRICFTNTSIQLGELFFILTYILNGYYPNVEISPPTAGGLKNCNFNNCKQSFKIRLNSTNKRTCNDYYIVKELNRDETSTITEVYDLEIDSEDHSFIADNMIVHNSVCETRIKTGFGMPQLSAIMDCARCAKPIIADGGIKTPGDVVKALAAGATMVMLGGMLAGCDETPGEIISTSNMPQQPEYMYNTAPIIYKKYRGMASREAYEDFFGTTMPNWKTSEGISVKVPCKGPVENVIKDIIGGLRSGLTYCGAENIKELQRGCEFIQITQAGKIESTAHYK